MWRNVRQATSPRAYRSGDALDVSGATARALTADDVLPDAVVHDLPAAHVGLPALDVLRFLSVCLIVWFHAGGAQSELFTFRLPAIALITALVQSRSTRWHPRSVLLPWLFWYGVYLALLLCRVAVHGVSAVRPGLSLYNPLAGPEYHLWYGPFALLAGIVAQRFRNTASSVLLAAAGIAFGAAFLLRGAPGSFPLQQWIRVLPAIAAGMLLARNPSPAIVLALIGMGTLGLGVQYAIAIPLVWAASQWTGERLKSLATFSRAVYWSHLLVAFALFRLHADKPIVSLLAAFGASGVLMLTSWTRRVL